MSAHTPGSWRLDEDGNVVAEDGLVARVYRNSIGRGEEEDEANARLIAAAPRMADALMKALAAGHEGDEPDWGDMEAALREAGVMP